MLKFLGGIWIHSQIVYEAVPYVSYFFYMILQQNQTNFSHPNLIADIFYMNLASHIPKPLPPLLISGFIFKNSISFIVYTISFSSRVRAHFYAFAHFLF